MEAQMMEYAEILENNKTESMIDALKHHMEGRL